MRTSTKHYANLRLRGSSDIETGDNELSKLPGSPTVKKQRGEYTHRTLDEQCETDEDAQNDEASKQIKTTYSNDGSVLLIASLEGDDFDEKTGTFTVQPGCRVITSKAFMYEDGLRHIVLPETLEKIESFAFACSGLQELDAPESLRSIGEKAFFQCSALSSITLNTGLEAIGNDAFYNSAIEKIDIPPTVSRIGRSAFSRTPIEEHPSAAGLVIEDNPHYLRDEQGGLYRKTPFGPVLIEMISGTIEEHEVLPKTRGIAQKAYAHASKLRSVVLPEGMVAIGKDAFKNCPRLRDANIPESLKLIGMNAFARTDIRSIYLPRGLDHLGPLALDTGGEADPSLKHVAIHPENERFFIQSGLLCERISPEESCVIVYVGPEKDVVIPRECTSIGPYAFTSSKKIRSIRLHKDITKANRFAIKSCCKVERLIVELPAPIEGLDIAEVLFPSDNDMHDQMFGIFQDGRLDLEETFRRSDRAAYYAHSNFERGMIICKRLLCPQLLDKTNRDLFADNMRRHLLDFCMAFAKHGYTEGFEQLVELGFLTGDNIGDAIDRVASLKDANISAYLLDLKARSFGHGVSNDYFLL